MKFLRKVFRGELRDRGIARALKLYFRLKSGDVLVCDVLANVDAVRIIYRARVEHGHERGRVIPEPGERGAECVKARVEPLEEELHDEPLELHERVFGQVEFLSR